MKKIICIDRHGKKHEVPKDELIWRPSVYGIVIKDGKILLSKQWDGYDFPGGGVGIPEATKDALVREVKEETGLDVTVGRLVACEDSFYQRLSDDTKKSGSLHSILIYYLCKVTGGELSISGIAEDEKKYVSMPEWVPLDDIDRIKFYNSIDSPEIIKRALEIT